MWRSCRQVPLLGGWLASGLGTRLLCAALQLAGWGGDVGGNAGSSDAPHARTAGIALVAAPAGIGAPPAAAPRCARPEASILKPRSPPAGREAGHVGVPGRERLPAQPVCGGRLPPAALHAHLCQRAQRRQEWLGRAGIRLAGCVLVVYSGRDAGEPGRDALRHGRGGSSRGSTAAPFASPCCASPACFARCPPK